jgi:predicted PurR-regulated permease PerM
MRQPSPPPVHEARRLDAVGLLIGAAAIVGLGFLFVRLVDVLLLVFASILLAILLHIIADPLRSKVRLERRLALLAALLVVAAAAGVLLWLFGSQISAQLASLAVLLPKSWHALEARLSGSTVGDALLEQARNATWPDNFLLTWATRLAGGVASAAAAIVIVITGGAYLAFHPETYAGGLVLLAPPHLRPRIRGALEACQLALKQWLLGQLVSIVFIGATTALGLWLAGVPSPLALGMVAGFGQLLPVVGPWIASVPGLVIALAQGPQTMTWALVVYGVTTQVESNFLTPLVLRQMASVPMAVTLFAMIAMGLLLGPVGALLSAPLATVAYVLVRKLYLEGVLGERL